MVQVQAQVDEGISGRRHVLAGEASHGAAKLSVETLVVQALTGSGVLFFRADTYLVELVQHELEILVGVLLTVAGKVLVSKCQQLLRGTEVYL